MKIICNPQDDVIESCVATIGFFDGVHAGHRYLIDQVKAVAANEGLHSALITFPVHPRQVIDADYSMELLSTLQERIELLGQTGVDYCFLLNFNTQIAKLTAIQFMSDVLQKQFHVQTLIIGYDHRFGHNRSEGFEDYCLYGKELGMEVLRAQAYMGSDQSISSSVIRTALLSGELEAANSYLGYNYYLDGVVVSGHRLGRTIGFPTANMVAEPEKLIPVDGVYAVRVIVEGENYIGMLNIGKRPTVNNGTNRTIEVNIFHFSADIYGKIIRVIFIQRIRSESKFDGIEKLIAQLHKDQIRVEEIFKNQV